MQPIFSYILLAILVTVPAPLLAQADFSGTWTMNPEKSSLGCPCRTDSLFAPVEAIRTIKQEGSAIMVSLVQKGDSGEVRAELTYLADGSRCTNELADCLLVSEAHWKENVLLVKSHLESDPSVPDWEDHWSLSEDGGVLTIVRDMCPTSGWDCQRLVFERRR